MLPPRCLFRSNASRHATQSHLRFGVQRRAIALNSRLFKISEEVRQALHERRPVVALETTIYTHGWPYPDNLALASRLESVVRLHGGVPATIGILEGVAHVGLAADELMRLASSKHALKISRRDLGFALGLKDAEGNSFNGGTTIAGTMVLAHLAGIKVFTTGGLGGVHRGAEQTMDISADLTELGRTPVAVISSGCKSFLDIPRTIEYLETQGVAVATFADGRKGNVHFPAFYSRDSEVESPKVLQDAQEAASVIHAHSMLGLQSGLHFANPVPLEHEIPFAEMEVAIAQANAEGINAGATGAAITPFILDKIKQLTGSRSLTANKALVESNVVMGAKVAKALVELQKHDDLGPQLDLPSQRIVSLRPHDPQSRQPFNEKTSVVLTNSTSTQVSPVDQNEPLVATHNANVFVAGTLALDYACNHKPRSGSTSTGLEMHTSNPAQISQSLGGVGHNVARAAHLMGAGVQFCSAVGDDLSGRAALAALNDEGLSSEAVESVAADSGKRTAQYVAVNEQSRDLAIAVADMAILDTPRKGEPDTIGTAFNDNWLPRLREARPSHLVLDANWPPTYLARWLKAGSEINAHITFEPVSNAKSAIPFQLPSKSPLSVFPKSTIRLITPNATELAAMYTAARAGSFFDRADWWAVIDALGIPSSGARTAMSLATSPALVDQGIPQQSVQLLPFFPSICTKLGARGVLVTQILPANDARLSSADHAPYILSRCNNDTEDSLGVGGVYMRLFPAVEEVAEEDVVSVNGVGDTFCGVLVAGLSKAKQEGREGRVEEWIDVAQRAAVLTLKSEQAVSPGLGTLRMLM
ncbi:hypothetical protein B0A48_03392 [Cryoendolithus antarcticus]|uniref:Carbohydrate kinase PfkB domain-containing protein n=1 Tax=Cryoendolithus antarcticus TaxID=1507870 RepID=A0A1V8TJW1_9PEZI|nr:hypothetical protein B0A48_03392 [Cryoendolithus antarcticus]